MNFIKKNKWLLILLFLIIAFLTARITITWDSAHYLSYVEIFEKTRPFSEWDIVRGPVFPIFIYLGNIIFGKNAIGIISWIYLFYLLYFYITYRVSKILFNDVKHSSLYSYIFVAFCVLNPLIFGYFHTLLTEFLAIILMLISCYISVKWVNVISVKKKVSFSLYYILALTFAYFLKQPYICTVFVPLFIAIILSIKNDHSSRNTLYRIGTFCTSIIFLFLSITIWNRFLVSRNVDMNTGRDSASLLNAQILGAVSNFDTVKISDYDAIKNDTSLSKKERNTAKKIFDDNRSILLVKIYRKDKLIESDLIPLDKNGNFGLFDTAKELMKFGLKHPVLLIASYSNNYCALSSVCVIETNNSVNYWITNKYEFIDMFENNVIGYKYLHSGSNLFYLSPEKYESAKFYEQADGLSFTSKIISLFRTPTNILYKMVMLLIPFMSLAYVVILIIKRKFIVRSENYYLSLIFLFSSFLTMIFSSVTWQIIDRYSVYCFIPALIGIVSSIFVIRDLFRRKVGK